MYFDNRANTKGLVHRAAFSITGDIGGEQGDGVMPFSSHHDPSGTGAACGGRAEREGGVRRPAQKLVGAVIHVRATPGMTAPDMARLLRCHALKDMAEQCSARGRCPLALRDVQVNVAEQATGFAVSIESQDPDVAVEILRRSEALRSLP